MDQALVGRNTKANAALPQVVISKTSSNRLLSERKAQVPNLFAGDRIAQWGADGSGGTFTIFDCVKQVNGNVTHLDC